MFFSWLQNIAEYQLKSIHYSLMCFIDLLFHLSTSQNEADVHVQPGVCSINVLSDGAELLLEELYTCIFSTPNEL